MAPKGYAQAMIASSLATRQHQGACRQSGIRSVELGVDLIMLKSSGERSFSFIISHCSSF